MTTRSRPARTFVPVLLAFVGSGALLGGCTSASKRDAYFAARSDTVMFSPGSGETRLSMDTDAFFSDSRGLAARHGPVTDLTRWQDAGLEP